MQTDYLYVASNRLDMQMDRLHIQTVHLYAPILLPVCMYPRPRRDGARRGPQGNEY
jgi:hypothetical protein